MIINFTKCKILMEMFCIVIYDIYYYFVHFICVCAIPAERLNYTINLCIDNTNRNKAKTL